MDGLALIGEGDSDLLLGKKRSGQVVKGKSMRNNYFSYSILCNQ